MNRVGIIGLLEIALPASTVRLCDGAFIVFGGNTYRSADPTFGTIASVEPMSEGIGEEVPALELTLLPDDSATPASLSQPGFQKSIVRFWIGEFDPETGLLDGTPDLMFHGQIDQTTLTISKGRRELAMTVVSTVERLFLRNRGNSLNPRFHKSVWPGELGHDNATGLTTPVAWGVESASGANGSSRGGGGGSYGGGGDGYGRYQDIVPF